MNSIRIKDILYEDFVNYCKPSMFIALGECDWKCCIEQNIDISICQNSEIAKQKDIEINISELFDKYVSNTITHSIVIAGLEPMTRFNEILNMIKYFRNNYIDDDIVVYTGYYPNEIEEQVDTLKQFKNIIIKFGRYTQNSNKKYDEILGIYLASDNQYAIKIS